MRLCRGLGKFLNTNAKDPPTAGPRSLLKEGLWVAGGQIASVAALLVGTRAITQFVNPEVFGRASLLQNLVGLLRSCGYSPLLNAGYRYYPEAEQGGQVGVLRALLRTDLQRMIAIASLPLAVIVIAWLGFSFATLATLSAVAVLLVSDVARNFVITLLSAARRQRQVAIMSVAESCARPAFIVLLVWLFGSSTTVVLVGVAASLLLPVLIDRVSAASVGRENLLAEPRPDYLEGLRRFAYQMTPYGAMTWVISVSDRYIIQWLSPHAADVGIYSAGYALVSQPFIMLSAILASTLRPVWFAAASQGEQAAARRTFHLWLTLAVVGAGAGVVLTWILAAWATRTLLAPEYGQAVVLLPWFAAGYLFFTLQQMFEAHLLAQKRSLAVLVTGVMAAGLAIVSTVPLVYHFGMLGAAYACPIYFSGHLAATAVLALRIGVRNAPR